MRRARTTLNNPVSSIRVLCFPYSPTQVNADAAGEIPLTLAVCKVWRDLVHYTAAKAGAHRGGKARRSADRSITIVKSESQKLDRAWIWLPGHILTSSLPRGLSLWGLGHPATHPQRGRAIAQRAVVAGHSFSRAGRPTGLRHLPNCGSGSGDGTAPADGRNHDGSCPALENEWSPDLRKQRPAAESPGGPGCASPRLPPDSYSAPAAIGNAERLAHDPNQARIAACPAGRLK